MTRKITSADQSFTEALVKPSRKSLQNKSTLNSGYGVFLIPGIVMFYTGQTYEQDGVEAKWRGVFDDNGRLMVGICHNMDIGDAWEHADMPRYPEHYASLAYRIGINYIMYAMTH